MSWHQDWISNTGNRSLAFRNQKNWDERTPEEVARLEFLRRKQQPEADWARDWSHVNRWTDQELGLKGDKNDAFTANRVSLMDSEEVQAIQIKMEEVYQKGTLETEHHYWDGAQVKACLRSGKMLSYAVRARIKPQTNFKHIQSWIVTEDLSALDQNFLDAVNEVTNQGYSTALTEIMAGDIATPSDRAKHDRQRRACDLVAKILRAWEAQTA